MLSAEEFRTCNSRLPSSGHTRLAWGDVVKRRGWMDDNIDIRKSELIGVAGLR